MDCRVNYTEFTRNYTGYMPIHGINNDFTRNLHGMTRRFLQKVSEKVSETFYEFY